MVEIFLLVAYTVGTGFGFYLGLKAGHKKGIVDTIDNLIEQGYLKYKGVKADPQILKHDEDY
tara:strand:- start:867 stop:1052 length:186 start_codon:yes stop_codon:yes gene_type:complete